MNLRLIILLGCAAALSHAQPQIRKDGVVNAASYYSPAANGGNNINPISPGSYFVIFGSGLGPASIAVAPSLPFGTQLPDSTGTSVRFVSQGNGQAYNAFMYYAVATQVSGILPSNVPPGPYNVIVTYNGRSSAAEQVFVPRTNPGIFTMNQAGTGMANAQVIVSASDYFTPTLSKPAAPGQNLVLYGTGLGPTGASDNNAPGAAPVGDPVTVYVDGMPVKPVYAGRSPQYPGLDQINLVLPADLVPSCYTDIVVGVNGSSSNVVAIPTAAPGAGACSHPMGLSAASLAKLDSGGAVNVGAALILQGLEVGDAGERGDIAVAFFATAKADGVQQMIQQIMRPNQSPLRVPVGKCAIWDALGPDRPGGNGLDTSKIGTINPAGSITLAGPGGKTYPMGPADAIDLPGGYVTLAPVGSFGAGAYTFQVNGGAIGALSIPMTIAAPLVWAAEPKDGATFGRAATKFSWTGGAPVVNLAGAGSSFAGNNASNKMFSCAFNGADGSGTVPGSILQSLPATPANGPGDGKLGMLSSSYGTFTAPGKLDGGMTIYASGAGHQVIWQ